MDQATQRAPGGLYLHASDAGPAARARSYDQQFAVTPAYRAQLPDMMDARDAVQGANVRIHQVGVSGFRLPLRYATRDGGEVTLETRVTGTVSLEANLKGINMSRIMRSFYERAGETFGPAALDRILEAYQRDLGSLDARLRLAVSWPIPQRSLRSGLVGWQYYDVVFEGAVSRDGRRSRRLRLGFVYSSACPCSAELSEHARDVRGAYAIPHSQRSKTLVTVELAEGADLAVEDLHGLVLAGLITETQVMVKREDEQAFAELNGAHIKFVEDAARLVFAQLDADPRIADFEVACSHLESLHSHDAVSVIAKGVPGGFRADFMEFERLVC